MVNGPQFGCCAPAYTYGIGLHGAGYDVTGNTPFAYLGWFGHIGRVSWDQRQVSAMMSIFFCWLLSAEKPGLLLA